MRKTVTKLHPAYQDDIGGLTTRWPVPGPGMAAHSPFVINAEEIRTAISDYHTGKLGA